MPLSETDIVNKALVMLGARPVNSLNESSDAGIAVGTLYSSARDALLREIPWNFARRQVALNELSAAPVNLHILPNNHGPGNIVYTGAFAAPNDFLRLFRWAPEDSHWRVIGSDTGVIFLTDATPQSNSALIGTQPPNADGSDNLPAGQSNVPSPSLIGCEYIARVTDPNQFDPLFVEALSVKLAEEMAFMIVGLESQQDRMSARFKEKLTEASVVNGIENWPDQAYDTTIGDVRYGYTGITIGS